MKFELDILFYQYLICQTYMMEFFFCFEYLLNCYSRDYVKLTTLLNRFVPDRGFAGADGSTSRSGPVEFQASGAGDKEEEDLFGVIGLLSEAKKASKRSNDDDRADRDKRRRRD